jgi:hypothetical protein
MSVSKLIAAAKPADAFEPVMVVFEDRPEGGLFSCLRPGFRHCFCLVARPAGWILCDPLKGRLRIELIEGATNLQLALHFLRSGRTVLLGSAMPPSSAVNKVPRPITCVEVVKRIVGCNAPTVWTPFQLCRHLLTGCGTHAGFHPASIDTNDVDSARL